MTIDTTLNALKTQEKSERPVYHKDIAQIIKQQLDTTKGLVSDISLFLFFM